MVISRTLGLMASFGLAAFAALQANATSLAGAPAVEQASPSAEDASGLVEERCTVCHAPNLIFAQRKSPDEWAATVQDMVDRGADLSPDEMEKVIQFLEQKYPEKVGSAQ